MKPNIRKRTLVLVLIFAMFFTYIQIPDNIVYGAVSYSGQTTKGDYTIGTKEQLNLLAQKVNTGTTYEGSTFTLTNNIFYDSSIQNNFTTIGLSGYPFKGIFNGNGFYISGINIYFEKLSYIGVFGYVDSGAIKNLGLINSYINAFNTVGGICSYAYNSTIDNCYNKSEITATTQDTSTILGGILGYGILTTVKNCYNEGTVKGVNAGGIAGYIYKSSILECDNRGIINGYGRYGSGIADSVNYSEITNCVNYGTFENAPNSTGISNFVYNTKIYYCKNYSNATSSGIGRDVDESTIFACENYGNISGSNAGGITLSSNYSTIAYCANFGNISGWAQVGGISGILMRGDIYYSYNAGTITASGDHYFVSAGGIAGYNNHIEVSGRVRNSYNIGVVRHVSTANPQKFGISGSNISSYDSYYLNTLDVGKGSFNDIGSEKARSSTYMKSSEFIGLLNVKKLNNELHVVNPFVLTSTKNNGYPVLWYQITVENIKIEGPATVSKGDTGVFKAVITPENAPNKKMQWTVSNTDLAEVIPVGDGEAVIIKGIKKGTVTLTAKAQDGSGVTATKSITIGSSFISSEASYILIDELVSFKTSWKDTENDPLYKSEYRYIHVPGKLKDGVNIDNTMGYVSYHNTWQTTAYKQFPKVGTYTIQYRVQDNPPTANKAGFENYRYYSDYVENTIYVHRKPIAVYSISSDVITDSSYDPDHSVSYSNKGIAKWEWTCVSNTGVVSEYIATTKTSGVNSVNSWINTYKAVGYKIVLRVQDVEGAWSEPTIKGVAEYSKPVADFAIERNPLTYPEQQNIIDMSYDTNGLSLSYQWTVLKGGTSIMTSTSNNITSTLNSKIPTLFPNVTGTYTVSLKVVNSAGVESDTVTKIFNVVVYNQEPTADFDLFSNESPAWMFPKILGLQTLKFRPINSFFHEEKTRFNVSVTDPNMDNTGFIYDWKLERFAVKDINGIYGAAVNTYSYTSQYPFTNSFKGQGLPWGAYQITLSVTDKPPVPPFASGDKKTSIVTKTYYIIPELSISGSFESAKSEIIVGDTIKAKTTTNKMTEAVTCTLAGSTYALNKISEDSNFAYWEKNIVVPDAIIESGTYQLQFVGSTAYGGNGSVTREVRDSVPINVIALKLINFRITDIVNHPHMSFPKTKAMLQAELIKYKAGYYVTFRIDSKGKPNNVYGRVDIGNNGSIDQIINLTKVASGDTETWQGRFYTSAYLPAGTVISIKLDCSKGSNTYDYNLKENWNGRSLIVNGSALMDGRINLTN